MKRYLVFAGDTHYPAGGWDDFIGDYDNLTEAFHIAKITGHSSHWWHVVDTQTKNVVHEITIEAHQ